MAVGTKYTNEYCEKIVKKHGHTLYRVIYLYLKNKTDADDVFQQVFLTLIEKKPRLKDENHEIAWLIRVGKNKCKDHLKNYWKQKTVALDQEGSFVMDEYTNEVLDAVYSLKEKYRTVIYMYYYEGYVTREISQILGIKEATIRTQLKRAREQLALLLGTGN